MASTIDCLGRAVMKRHGRCQTRHATPRHATPRPAARGEARQPLRRINCSHYQKNARRANRAANRGQQCVALRSHSTRTCDHLFETVPTAFRVVVPVVKDFYHGKKNSPESTYILELQETAFTVTCECKALAIAMKNLLRPC